jgi:hypothetical protein
VCRDAEKKSKIVAGCYQYMNDRLDLHDMKHEQMVVFASDPYFEAMRRLQCFGDAVQAQFDTEPSLRSLSASAQSFRRSGRAGWRTRLSS